MNPMDDVTMTSYNINEPYGWCYVTFISDISNNYQTNRQTQIITVYQVLAWESSFAWKPKKNTHSI